MRRHLTALLCAGLLLAACGGNDDSGDSSAITSIPDDTTTTSSTTTEPRTVAPDVIPQDVSLITEEYVERVLNELYEVSLSAIIRSREAQLVDETTIAVVESTNSPPQARRTLNGLIDLSARSFDGFREDPRPVTADVIEVVSRDSGCIFAEVRFDTSGLVVQPSEVQPGVRGFVRLVAASDQQRSLGHNPTAWVIDGLPVTEDGTVPEEACPAP